MAEDSDLPFQDPNFPLRLFTNKEVEAINTKLTSSRARRVRAALYPETFDSVAAADDEILSAAYVQDGQSAVMRLAPEARELKDAIADIVAYMIDADFADKFVPEIAKLLGDKDSDVVRNAAELTNDLVRSEAACQVISRSPKLVSALLRAAGSAGDNKKELRTKEVVANAIMHLGKTEQGRLTIFKTGGIELLVRLLAAPAEKVVNFAISSLHALLTYQEGAKLAVRLAGGIQKMVPLLPKWNKDPKFLAMVLDCLHLLAYGDTEAKLAIWNCKGPKEVVTVFDKAKDEKVLLMSSRLLRVLSTCSQNKEAIVEAGGFDSMVKKLGTDDPKLFQNYLTTLRNLSDAEADFPCDSTVMSYLLQFLRSQNQETMEIAAGTFGNLSSDKPRLKEAIFNAGGVDIVLQTIRKTQSEETLEPLLCTLRHLTSKHRLVSEAQKEMRELGGLELALHQLYLSWQRPEGVGVCWPLVKASCGLVRNLVADEENHDALVRFKAIPRLGQILALAAKEDRKHQEAIASGSGSGAIPTSVRHSRNSLHRSMTLERGSTASMVGGVDLNDIKETSIGALADLAKASMVNKEEVAALNVGPLLIKLRHEVTSSEEVVEACTALLEALRLDEEDGGRGRSTGRQEEPKKEEEEFGVKVEAGDRVIVARARSIQVEDDDRAATLPHKKEDHYRAGKKSATLKQDYMGSTTSLKVAREGEEKRRRGFFGGGAKHKKQAQKQKKEVIYENMEELRPQEEAVGSEESHDEREREAKKDKKKAKPRMREEPVWMDSQL